LYLQVFPFSLQGTLIEDFDDGDMEGWERSPQNEKSKVFWGVKDGAMVFDPKGIDWSLAIGQLNFAGTSKVSNVRDWTNYDFEADLKHEQMANCISARSQIKCNKPNEQYSTVFIE